MFVDQITRNMTDLAVGRAEVVASDGVATAQMWIVVPMSGTFGLEIRREFSLAFAAIHAVIGGLDREVLDLLGVAQHGVRPFKMPNEFVG